MEESLTVGLPPDSEPEPDHAVVRGTIRDYRHGHPGPADVALVVESAATSLREDRAMAIVYANARSRCDRPFQTPQVTTGRRRIGMI